MNAVPVINFYIGLTMFVYIYRSKQYWGLCCFSRFEIFQFLVFPVQAYQQVSFKLFIPIATHNWLYNVRTWHHFGNSFEIESRLSNRNQWNPIFMSQCFNGSPKHCQELLQVEVIASSILHYQLFGSLKFRRWFIDSDLENVSANHHMNVIIQLYTTIIN